MTEKTGDWQFVCRDDQLAHAQCLEFELSAGSNETQAAFVLGWGNEYFAYLNSCPHTRISMNWAPDQFFDFENQFLQCGLHGALFEPATGLCIRGPCLGQQLTELPLKHENGQIFAKNPS